MKKIWSPKDIASLLRGLTKVLENDRFWPSQETLELAQRITPAPAVEVAVVNKNRVLLQYRLFDEWPVPYNKPGWYIPGGYIRWTDSLIQSCYKQLNKDLAGEYKRVGIAFDPDSIKLGNPVVIGSKKWQPGIHPWGAPVSLVCVCELIAGTIVETDCLIWSNEAIATDVPMHNYCQAIVFDYLNSSEDKRQWLAEMQNRW